MSYEKLIEKWLNFVRTLTLWAVVQHKCRFDLEFVIVIAAEGGWTFNLFLTKKNVIYLVFQLKPKGPVVYDLNRFITQKKLCLNTLRESWSLMVHAKDVTC
jgi:hypothetical protein